MKIKELRLINESDLEKKIIELKKELMKVNSQIAIGTLPKSPSKVKEMKRTIAKILTIKQEKHSKRSLIKNTKNTGSEKQKEVQKRNE